MHVWHVQKPWKVHVNIIDLPVTLTDVHDHLYRYGGFPPLMDVKKGLLRTHPKAQLQGRYSTKYIPGWQPWFFYVGNSHFGEDNLNYHPLIAEVFLATQGLTQMTTLLCSIIMSSVHDNTHQNCNILQCCLIGTYCVT